MPVEIKEMHINIKCQDNCEQPKKNSGAPDTSSNQVNDIVAECVEQILNIIRQREER